MGRRSFLRLCGAMAPALLLPALTPSSPGATAQGLLARKPALAPPDAPRLPQRATMELVMSHVNPVVADNCPDPGVLDVGGAFYMVSTTHVLPAFPIRVSRDLVNWEHTGRHVFTRANQPSWARDHFWAPELHRVGDRYVCYYTARSTLTNRLCIGVATADSPEGPYTDLGRPLVAEEVAVLDPTFFRDDDGRHYLYWKKDAPDGPGGPILVQELTADGLALAGPRHEVLRNDLGWEGRLVEAPAMVKRDGAYYLFYSGADYDSPGYAIGVARSSSPTSGFEKRGEPILRGSGRWKGPGHCSVVRLQGQDYLVYHAWQGERFRDHRPTLVDRLAWTDDGWPAVNDGSPGG